MEANRATLPTRSGSVLEWDWVSGVVQRSLSIMSSWLPNRPESRNRKRYA
jgi:hypothetical protein